MYIKRNLESTIFKYLDSSEIIAIESKSYLKSKRNSSVEIFKKKYPEVDVYFSYKSIAKSIKEAGKAYSIYFY